MESTGRKKILVVGLTNIIGGVETFIYNSVLMSKRDEYEYDFLIRGTNSCVFQNEINAFYGDNSHFYFIRKYKENTIECIKDLFAFFKQHGKEYKCIHLQTGDTSDVLYVFPFSVLYGIPVVAHSHSAHGTDKVFKNRLFRPLLNLVSSVKLACSKEAAEWLYGKRNISDVVILNNGIKTDLYKFHESGRSKIRTEFGIKDELVIGQVGRMVEGKNHEFSLLLLKRLMENHPDAKLIFVGDGEKKAYFEQMVRDYGLSANVIFTGIRTDIHDFYSAFDVFIMPSLYEGLPMVGIEAQASGVKCIFSDCIDSQILITDQAKAYSLEDLDGWVDAVASYKSNKNRSAYAEVLYNKGYDIQTTIDHLSAVYDSFPTARRIK